MENVLIYVVTALFFLLFLVSLDDKKINVNHLFYSVQEAYQGVMMSAEPFGSALVKIGSGIVVSVIGILSFLRSQDIAGGKPDLQIVGLAVCIFILLVIGMYFLLGIPLLIFTRIENLIITIHQHKLSGRFLISAYILFMYSLLLALYPKAMVRNALMVFVGLAISYMLNLIMLINIGMEPLHCFQCQLYKQGKVEQRYPLKVVIAGAIILIILIVINLYLGVIMIYNVFAGAYVNMNPRSNITRFDLFYYTVISFTTIGYGEIVPGCLESKWMAILIAYTSVMCLVIFVTSVLALKNELLK